MSKRIELTTIAIKLRNTVKSAKTREGCCVVFTTIWNNSNMIYDHITYTTIIYDLSKKNRK